VEEDSPDEYDVDYIEPVLNGWRIYDPEQADVVSADENEIVVSLEVRADVSFGVTFTLQHWDSIDREYARLKSDTVWVPRESAVAMVISISRGIEPGLDVYEISASPARVALNLRDVQPDFS
jgi:hypothetical protein